MRKSSTKFSSEHRRRPDQTVSATGQLPTPPRAVRNVPKLMIPRKLSGYESTKNSLQLCHRYVGTAGPMARAREKGEADLAFVEMSQAVPFVVSSLFPG